MRTLLSTMVIARLIQMIAMLGCAIQLSHVARNLQGRPRLSLWLHRISDVLFVLALIMTLAAFSDAFEWLGPGVIWTTAAVNAILWIALDLHLRATRRAARRTPPEVQGRVLAGVDELLNEMRQSKAKATRGLEQLNRT